MYRLLLASLGICLLAAACSRPKTGNDPAAAAPSAKDASPPTVQNDDVADFVVGAPGRHANLTVFPVLSKVPKETDRFVTLDEGLKSGVIEIFEVGATSGTEEGREENEAAAEAGSQADEPGEESPGEPQQASDGAEQREMAIGEEFGQDDVGGEVEHLMVINRSDKPLYLMPGQIIVGGKQDRTIANETFIPPTDEPVAIDVFCVEQGRWSSRDDAENYALMRAVTDGELPGLSTAARPAGRGHFTAIAGNLSKPARLKLQSTKDQQGVWEAVSSVNVESGAESTTGTFTANYADSEIIERFRPYVERLEQEIGGQERVVGVIVAVNGKVEAMDIFESTPLFRKLWPTLLKSYALDASNAVEEAADHAVCTIEQANEFLAKAMTADVDESHSDGDVHRSKRSSEGVIGFEGDFGGGGLGGGDIGGGAHGAFFAE